MTTYFLNQPMDWINQTIHYVANESNTNTFKSQWKIVLNKSEKENYKCRNVSLKFFSQFKKSSI